MLDKDTRIAVFELHRKELGTRAIARALKISRNAVKRALHLGDPAVPVIAKTNTLEAQLDLIRTLHVACRGNAVRVQEELEKKGFDTSYSTLTRFLRTHDLGVRKKEPSGTYLFEPGQEMQHDTSPHVVEIGGRKRKLQCASLVLCWSRMIYGQCYPTFNRFLCRLFLDEAVQYFGGASERCMVDNTSVVVVGGSGKHAVFADELTSLGDRFGYHFKAHAVGHAKRSGRVERPFHYIENNFYPGRTFESLDDLNVQLRAWCEKSNAKYRKRLGASPRERLVTELPALKSMPLHLPEVYALHVRRVDAEGYVTVHCQRYSVAIEHIGHKVQVRETRDRIIISQGRKELAVHAKAEAGKSSRNTLPGHERRWSRARRREPTPNERDLRAAGAVFEVLVDALRKAHGGRAHRQMSRLHQMYRDYPTAPMTTALARANEFGLINLTRIERMILREIGGSFFSLPTPTEEDPDG